MAGTFAVYALLVFARFDTKRGPHIMVTWFVSVYLVVRQGIRVFDFEESISLYEEVADW